MFEQKTLTKEQIELFNTLKQCDVFLEEERHVYIHKTTGEYFLSVTGVLNLIKNKTDFTSIKKGIHNQYNTILNWVNKFALSDDEIIEIIKLYANYKNFRPYELQESFYGDYTYKKYKHIDEYSLPEFYNEFLSLKTENKLLRYKPVYVDNNLNPLTPEQIQKLWYDITDVANIYGSFVHTIVEQYILLKQRFVNQELEDTLKSMFLELKNFLKNLNYKYNSHIFDEYIIDVSYEEFKIHIIYEFNKLGVDLGRVCVPERLLYYKKYSLCGMTDVYVDINDKEFDLGDHKTNKNFTFESEYDNKLLGKLSHMDECDYNLYNLQLSIYALIIESVYGKKLRKLWISYYNRLEHNFTYFPLEYLKDEAQYLLELHLNTITKRRKSLKKLLKNVPEKYVNHLVREIYRDINKKILTKKLTKQNKSAIFTSYKTLVENYLEEQKKYKY